MIKIKLKQKKVLLLAVIAMAVAITLISTTIAWLLESYKKTHLLAASSLLVYPKVYFLHDEEKLPAEQDENGYYIADLSNPDSPTFAGKLRVEICYKGVTMSYLRVFISDMWITHNYTESGLKDTVFLKGDTVFRCADGWLDNRVYDKYFYYTEGENEGRGIINAELDDEVTDEVTLDFIEGIQDLSVIADGAIYLDIRAEAVQFNRLKAFWGIDALPVPTPGQP